MKKIVFIGATMLLGMVFFGNRTFAQTEEVEVKVYCDDYNSDGNCMRATGIGESRKQQQSKLKARTAALEELASKIEMTLNMYAKDFTSSMEYNEEEDFAAVSGKISEQIVKNSFSNYKTVCEKFTTYTDAKGVKKYKCYMALEFTKKDVEKAVYDGLSKEGALKVGYAYSQFQKEFDKAFDKEVERENAED